MKEITRNGNTYKLPSSLSKFQKEMYVHFINWKWRNITKEPGVRKYKGESIEYDAILPETAQKSFPIIYKSILDDLIVHKEIFPFKFHTYFNHMVSSQAANINLFLPMLLSSKANEIFRQLKPDFKKLATEELYKGFRIEYWDGNSNKEKGLLADHNARSGTDSDIGIAYYNHNDHLCLWLIEHKLTEKDFTNCGGYKSKNRNKAKHLCEKSFSDILNNKDYCYYHNVRKNRYWEITDKHKDFFVNHKKVDSCPFGRGLNQLWRNQLLGFAIEDDTNNPFKQVCFSVVHHSKNRSNPLKKSIADYKELIDNNPKFTIFTSEEVVNVAEKVKDKNIVDWINWYKELYQV